MLQLYDICENNDVPLQRPKNFNIFRLLIPAMSYMLSYIFRETKVLGGPAESMNISVIYPIVNVRLTHTEHFRLNTVYNTYTSTRYKSNTPLDRKTESRLPSFPRLVDLRSESIAEFTFTILILVISRGNKIEITTSIVHRKRTC